MNYKTYFEDYTLSLTKLGTYFDFDCDQVFDNALKNIMEIVVPIEFNFAISSVYSSNIEGNSMDLNSFFNYDIKSKKINHQKKEIDHLIKAYSFAQKNKLNYKNFLEAHKILSHSFLDSFQRGKIRTNSVGVFGSVGLVYLALEPQKVDTELQNLFGEIEFLLNTNLSLTQVFYYASFLHLRIAHIHPFADGNGRIARLVEKWFLSSKLTQHGRQYVDVAWKINSEKYYKENQIAYYQNISLGSNFYELDYTKAKPFLLMLPNAVVL